MWQDSALLTDPIAILVVLLAVLAAIFRIGETAFGKRVFSVIPSLVFCYFVRTTLTTLGILPAESVLYDWIKLYLLPASLMLLILALDVPGIIRLGPKALIMMLAGTSSTLFGMMVIVDVTVANVWMGVLLYLAGQQERVDRLTRADTTAIDELKHRVAEFTARTTRVPTLTDLLVIMALGFGGMWLATLAGRELGRGLPLFDATVWKFITVTALAVALSFTPARRLEGAGASKIGTVMLYLLVASIGAHADFTQMKEAPILVGVGAV